MTSFIDSDEHLILMDMQVRYEEPLIRLPKEDIQKLVDAGIRTAMLYHCDWNVLEPEKGKRSFQYFDDRVGLLNDCGMKAILQCFSFVPEWMPNGWMVSGTQGIYRAISPWHPEAYEYALDFIREFHDHFTQEKCMTMNSWLTDGETLFPNDVCVYDENAIDAFSKMYGTHPKIANHQQIMDFLLLYQNKLFQDVQNIHVTGTDEIWHSLHLALSGYVGNGCAFMDRFMTSFRDAHPYSMVNHMYCTWVQWSGLWKNMKLMAEDFGESMWGGAEYAENVVNTTKIAKSQSMRGLLIGPCHPHTGHRRIESWMVENITTANNLWLKE